MDAIEQRAEELGRLVGQSEEYLAWRRAEERLTADDELRTSLDRLAQLQLAAAEKAEKGEAPPAEVQSELDTLWSRVQVSPLYQGYIASRTNFDKMMYKVNETILEGMKRGSESRIITLG
ncbi:MAG TPA: YlbF family regulator [Candidatus Methylomirabilis sp.]|nr:YlbF family regulator [Candidatus Methylomirabilis sp.]